MQNVLLSTCKKNVLWDLLAGHIRLLHMDSSIFVEVRCKGSAISKAKHRCWPDDRHCIVYQNRAGCSEPYDLEWPPLD